MVQDSFSWIRKTLSERPPYSQDLNPIDYSVWSILGARVCAKLHKSLKSLVDVLKRLDAALGLRQERKTRYSLTPIKGLTDKHLRELASGSFLSSGCHNHKPGKFLGSSENHTQPRAFARDAELAGLLAVAKFFAEFSVKHSPAFCTYVIGSFLFHITGKGRRFCLRLGCKNIGETDSFCTLSKTLCLATHCTRIRINSLTLNLPTVFVYLFLPRLVKLTGN